MRSKTKSILNKPQPQFLSPRTSSVASPLKTAEVTVANGFVELLARSNFSFLQGASHPEEMVEEAIRLDYNGIALCDLHGVYGVVRGFQTATSPSLFGASLSAKQDFRYLVGTEFILTDETKVAFLPMTKKGYAHLCQLITLGKRQAGKGFSRLSWEDIEKYHEDLLLFYIPPFQTETFLKMKRVFDDRLYLPIWKDLTWESQEFIARAFELEQEFEAQLFVTNRPFHHIAERKPLFDVMTCILHHTTLEKAKLLLIQNGERHLKPLNQLSQLWQSRLDLVEKTVDIAGRIEFSLKELRYRYPESNLPAGMTPSQYIRTLSYKGLSERYEKPPAKVIEMMEHELSLISDLQYEDYFLTLWEICQFAKEQGILHQGRGSAANSVVCFALGLTSVDPTQVELLFERFISKERGEPPDIDIDFEHERREEVLQHIYEKYDEHHAAMICTVIRYRSRMAFREVSKVFGVSLATVNKIIRFMGRDGMRRLLETPQIHQQFGIEENQWKMILALAGEMHGFPRHLGIHTGGFLITHQPLIEVVPVEKATMNRRFVIQWNKDDVDFLKLMKIDFLSLGMLSALRKCLELLKSHKNLDYHLYSLPHDDKATYDMICQADTVGVFQIESRAQMQTLPRLKPRNFYDIVIEVALVRPGPLQGGMVHPYLRRRQGLEEVVYPHPDLEKVLKKTLGVPIFQEQVMQIAIHGAGFTPGEADELRRVMSNAWRKKGTMEGVRQRIMEGLSKKGIEPHFAEQIYKTIEGFANYGFPESHAASFALLTYASCYIKCHHPEVFVCALLNSQPMGFYPPRMLIADAQRHHVIFLPLDVQDSHNDYTLEPVDVISGGLNKTLFLTNPLVNPVPSQRWAVRVGLRSIQGFSEKWSRQIRNERLQNGFFQSLEDFIQRTRLPKNALKKLAQAGALKSFNEQPRELLWKIESLCLDEDSLFWGHSKEKFEDSEDSQHLPAESSWNELKRLYEVQGFSLTHHPLYLMRQEIDLRNDQFKRSGFVLYRNSQEIQTLRHKTSVRLVGLISMTQRPPTAKGFCFLSLEDEYGIFNVIVPPDVYQKDRLTIYSESILEVHGVLERQGPLTNIRALRCLPWQSSSLKLIEKRSLDPWRA